jgi:hypothetical protein
MWMLARDKFEKIYRMPDLFPISRISLLKKLLLAGVLVLYSARPLLDDYFRLDGCKTVIEEYIYHLPEKSLQGLLPYCKALGKKVFRKLGNQTIGFILYQKNTGRLQKTTSTETAYPAAGIFSIMIGNLNGNFPSK